MDGDVLFVLFKCVVIVSEDLIFVDYGGVDWDVLEKVWEKN